ncbi:SMI1/KNR4 family protein [Streptomyces sp. NBC_01267]|uniref:SMI1/KNR4 family protein n=1 Tax=Streptomyces sp. NBC_01267 TaxID=2903805 RepID=UPI002E2FC2DC|nr:SMI1/KNR4 family protein [Streptomyces sp. NBC_01267]
MTEAAFNWPSFLQRWSDEWADSWAPDEALDEADEEARRARWLGFAPASAERIAALEERLGCPLPPSYRSFLEVSDGWRNAGGFVYVLAGTESHGWQEDEVGIGEMYREELDEDSTEEEIRLVEDMWDRTLPLDVESDATYVMLNPGDLGADGEWAVYCYRTWAGEMPERYASFREFMAEMYREFHHLRAGDPGSATEFVNATTRKLDAVVEQARCDALAGEYRRAEDALAEAVEYGRPRAAALRDQIRWLLGDSYLAGFDGLTDDPVYALEMLSVLAVGHVERSHDDAVWAYTVRPAPGDLHEAADEIRRQVGAGTFRYVTSGPFGDALDEARELARWGEADAAWRTVLAALPQWRPLGPCHLAPIGLLADALLGPLLTPERGRELLAAPRGEAAGGEVAAPVDLEPGGLDWLAAPGPHRTSREAYRFILVESAHPAELPDRVGAEGSSGLNTPMTACETQTTLLNRGETSSYDDKALASVGRAGSGWSFAFDGQPSPFDEQRFVSPAAAASGPGHSGSGPGSRSGSGSRAMVVWSDPGLPHHGSPALFHFSLAENGEERYDFTVHGSTIRRSGEIPPALDPDRLFGNAAADTSADPDADPDADSNADRDADPAAARAEQHALEAIATEFGVSLPRFALTHGRLHTFQTCSWTRPPGPGETYMTVTLGQVDETIARMTDLQSGAT